MTIAAVAFALTLSSCGTAEQQAAPTAQEIAPVFVFENGEVTRSTESMESGSTVTRPPSTQQSNNATVQIQTGSATATTLPTTPVMQINPDGSVSQVGTLVVTTLPPEALGGDLTALQIEIINWRTFQRKAAASVHGESPQQSECIVENAIRALPQELLPQLTNPAQATTQMSTVELFAEEVDRAKTICL